MEIDYESLATGILDQGGAGIVAGLVVLGAFLALRYGLQFFRRMANARLGEAIGRERESRAAFMADADPKWEHKQDRFRERLFGK